MRLIISASCKEVLQALAELPHNVLVCVPNNGIDILTLRGKLPGKYIIASAGDVKQGYADATFEAPLASTVKCFRNRVSSYKCAKLIGFVPNVETIGMGCDHLSMTRLRAMRDAKIWAAHFDEGFAAEATMSYFKTSAKRTHLRNAFGSWYEKHVRGPDALYIAHRFYHYMPKAVRAAGFEDAVAAVRSAILETLKGVATC